MPRYHSRFSTHIVNAQNAISIDGLWVPACAGIKKNRPEAGFSISRPKPIDITWLALQQRPKQRSKQRQQPTRQPKQRSKQQQQRQQLERLRQQLG